MKKSLPIACSNTVAHNRQSVQKELQNVWVWGVKTFCSVGEADLGHKRLQQHGSFGYFDSTDKWEQTVSEALETKDAMGANWTFGHRARPNRTTEWGGFWFFNVLHSQSIVVEPQTSPAWSWQELTFPMWEVQTHCWYYSVLQSSLSYMPCRLTLWYFTWVIHLLQLKPNKLKQIITVQWRKSILTDWFCFSHLPAINAMGLVLGATVFSVPWNSWGQ